MWPYFLYQTYATESRRTVAEAPLGVQNFLLAMDALGRANALTAPASSQERVNATSALFRDAVAYSQNVDRAELNAVYSGLGDRFLDDAIGAAELYLEGLATSNRGQLTSAAATWARWASWWRDHSREAMFAFADRYNLDIRIGP